MGGAREPVDVVIPVYNAPDLTRRCIDSVYAQLGERLGDVIVEDDASAPETASMLDALTHRRLRIYHAERNQGFGAGVNRGVGRSHTRFVLVLNSDVEARRPFLDPLLDAMRADERLAAISPAGSAFGRYRLSHYQRRAGYIPSYALWGYAFLLRRSAFDEVGRFDPLFGRGYYEDTDLARRLLAGGWRLGVHPDAELYHREHGSFSDDDERGGLLAENRTRYLARYPEARRQLLLLTGRLRELPPELDAEIASLLRAGGVVQWLHAGPAPSVPALPMQSRRFRLTSIARWMQRRRRKGRREFTDLWILEGAPPVRGHLLAGLARRWGVQIRRC